MNFISELISEISSRYSDNKGESPISIEKGCISRLLSNYELDKKRYPYSDYIDRCIHEGIIDKDKERFGFRDSKYYFEGIDCSSLDVQIYIALYASSNPRHLLNTFKDLPSGTDTLSVLIRLDDIKHYRLIVESDKEKRVRDVLFHASPWYFESEIV